MRDQVTIKQLQKSYKSAMKSLKPRFEQVTQVQKPKPPQISGFFGPPNLPFGNYDDYGDYATD